MAQNNRWLILTRRGSLAASQIVRTNDENRGERLGNQRRLLMLESLTGSSRTVKPGVSTHTLVWAELPKANNSQAPINKDWRNHNRMPGY